MFVDRVVSCWVNNGGVKVVSCYLINANTTMTLLDKFIPVLVKSCFKNSDPN